MLNSTLLDEMSMITVDKIDKNTLFDIKTVKIDASLPVTERMQQYLEQVKNPYCFMCSGTPVRIRFSDTGKTLDEALKSHFLGLKNL